MTTKNDGSQKERKSEEELLDSLEAYDNRLISFDSLSDQEALFVIKDKIQFYSATPKVSKKERLSALKWQYEQLGIWQFITQLRFDSDIDEFKEYSGEAMKLYSDLIEKRRELLKEINENENRR